MVDLFVIVLNDPQYIGKDVFGYERITLVLEGVADMYDLFFDALTLPTEADYMRSKMDETIRVLFRLNSGMSTCRRFGMTEKRKGGEV